MLGELVRLQQVAQAAHRRHPSWLRPPVPAMMAAGRWPSPRRPRRRWRGADAAADRHAAAGGRVDPDDDVVDDKAVDADGVDLQVLARNAAMKAEREAIDQALAKFRWNRRKAAAYLKVSYKTLLNKMKECGISEPAGAS